MFDTNVNPRNIQKFTYLNCSLVGKTANAIVGFEVRDDIYVTALLLRKDMRMKMLGCLIHRYYWEIHPMNLANN